MACDIASSEACSAPVAIAPRVTSSRRAVEIITGLLCAILLPAVLPRMPESELHADFNAHLAHFFRSHLQHGVDIVFTYGPYGFLGEPRYHKYTWLLAQAINGAAAMLIFVAMAYIARLYIQRNILAALWLVVAGFLVTGIYYYPSWATWSQLPFLYLFLWLLPGRTPTPGRDRLQFAIVVALGLGVLIKFSIGVPAALVVLGCAAHDLLRHRRFPWLALVFAASLVFFWVLAKQHVANLPMFFLNSWRMSEGFNEMAMTGPVKERWLTVMLIVVLIWALLWLCRREWTQSVTAGLVTLLLCLIQFRLAFARHDDGHVMFAVLTLLAAAWLLLPPLLVDGRDGKIGAAIVTTAILVWSFSLPHLVPVAYDKAHILHVQRVRDVIDVAARYDQWRSFAQLHRDLIKTAAQLPALPGTVDTYPCGQQEVLVAGLQFKPRPVFQSYATYTPELLEINAAHLRGPDAPDFLLWRMNPIDGRYGQQEESLSWPEVLSRYEPSDYAAPHLHILQRRAQPQPLVMQPISTARHRTGEWIDVPEATAGPIWAKINLDKLLSEKVRGTFYQTHRYTLELREAQTGAIRKYRYMRSSGEAGFVLSPQLETANFVDLYYDQGLQALQAGAVEAFRLVPQSGSQREFSVSYSRLEYRRVWAKNFDAFNRGVAPQVVNLHDATAIRPHNGEKVRPVESGLEVTTAGYDAMLLVEMPKSDRPRVVQVEMTAPVASTLNLYWLDGKLPAYNANLVAVTRSFAGRRSYFVALPANAQGPLRLDPGSTPGTYFLHRVEFREVPPSVTAPAVGPATR